jgi:hypothetical protein
MTKQEVYTSEISPLVGEIVKRCVEVDIPLLATFCLDSERGLHATACVGGSTMDMSPELLAMLEIVAGACPEIAGAVYEPI